ncbi:prepilin-type N-terminal cleavage/methylation domain-containing protein [Fundicoccus sp. Sow4_D5]|uniref:prepilin-type N-terminal cleavage/methylation domain-containing protein n=1 Tax=unclassified Fundicoccus TaxID=2761543 RepID=UPI003F8DD16F
MSYVNKKGFTFIESLVGLSLFSLILMLYLPAFYLELSRVSTLQRETQHWQIFHELVSLRLDPKVTDEQFELAKHSIATKRSYIVNAFDCQAHQCFIQFSDGEVYDVILEEISPSAAS